LKKVLIIDDVEKLRTLLSRIIKAEGFEVIEAEDCKSALQKLDHNDITAVLSDVKLPDGNGIDLIKKIKAKFPFIEVILMTAYGNIQDGVQAMKNGAFDYLVKGDENEKIIPLLHRAVEKTELQLRLAHLEDQLKNKYSFDSILGKSKLILSAIDLAKKVACTDTTVLLTGETGTGKEVFAQAIHQASSRNTKNFVAINCSAFSKDLLESEMFGHKAGAFTGAIKDKKGLFEEANNGIIFLDEIGEMALDLQAKLLRVIENGEFIKVGDSKVCKVNIRIIAATNRLLEQEIEDGRFRQDLFYRLSVFQIKLPALRERVSDLEILAKYFISIFSAKTNKKVKSISVDFLEALKQHQWSGNIRELKNVIERSVILSDSEDLCFNTLPIEIQNSCTGNTGKVKTLSAFDLACAEKIHIQKVMNYTNGNKTETAKLLNIALTTLYRKLEEFKIS
jgi:two-component system NtrC family response regulator